MLHGPQKKPAVPQSWRSQYAELGELADLGEQRAPREPWTRLCCRCQAKPRPVARGAVLPESHAQDLSGTAWDLQLHTCQDAGRFRALHCMRLEALAGVHGRSVLGDSGVASLYSVAFPELWDPR